MSYCRSNGKDSDVYMYAGKAGLTIHVNTTRDLSGLVEPYKNGATNSYGECLYMTTLPAVDATVFLLEVAARGVNVPERAVRRLAEEMIRGEWSTE